MWDSEQDDFTNMLKHGNTQVWLAREKPDYLEVMSEQGSGYGREFITTNIPMELLVKLMEHAGFKVTK